MLYAKLFMQERLTQFLFYLEKLKIHGTLFCGNDNIKSSGETGFMKSIEFSDAPFEFVSLHCISHLPVYGNPYSGVTRVIFHKNDCKMRCLLSFAQTI